MNRRSARRGVLLAQIDAYARQNAQLDAQLAASRAELAEARGVAVQLAAWCAEARRVDAPPTPARDT